MYMHITESNYFQNASSLQIFWVILAYSNILYNTNAVKIKCQWSETEDIMKF